MARADPESGRNSERVQPQRPADTEDPEGLLTTASWLTWVQTNNLIGPGPSLQYVGYPLFVTNQNNLLANAQYRLTPVIMSVGANGKDDQGAVNSDDIYNFQLGSLGGTNN